ncbi:MAG: hypothetical protein FJW37_14180 [Acidobacteria bacterium]|nr:hypothetical protein [Acidobacteriota bacterium]
MERRTCLLALPAAGAAALLPAQSRGKPIQLHLDLNVDPAREKEMVANFHKIFRPTIRKQPGFVEVKLMKLRETLAGAPPANATYRLLISFETEEQRKQWVAADDHQRAWPAIESTLRGAKYGAVLFDLV